MARKQSNVWLSVLLLVLGVLLGYAAAGSLRGTAAPEARPLPYEAPLVKDPQLDLQKTIDNPGGYSEPEMAFSGYLGIHNQYIAIFEGEPPTGKLQYVTDYEVREDLRDQLEAGVPFSGSGELLTLLENYTS
jgi:hypothetical protein